MLWGALHEGAVAKAQLLLRLLRTLSVVSATEERGADRLEGGGTAERDDHVGDTPADGALPTSSWLQLATTATAMLSACCEPLLLEALRLLTVVLHVCEDDTSNNVLGTAIPKS